MLSDKWAKDASLINGARVGESLKTIVQITW
jgi:hypothetical protein